VKPSPIRIEHERPGPERRLELPEQDVEERRRRERERPEQVRRARPDRVGDDPRRHLEEHHPGGEERVRRERLEVREARVEQKIVLIPQISDAASVFRGSG
jgi:hypothetical protein